MEESILYYHRWCLTQATHPYWDTPTGYAVMELKMGVSQLRWVQKTALVFMGLAQYHTDCLSESHTCWQAGHSETHTDTGSTSSGESGHQQSRKKPVLHRTSLSSFVTSMPLPEQQGKLEPCDDSTPPLNKDYNDYSGAPLYTAVKSGPLTKLEHKLLLRCGHLGGTRDTNCIQGFLQQLYLSCQMDI